MLKLDIKRIDIKNKMTEVMKKKVIEWAEENPDKTDALHIAKTRVGNISDWDETVAHCLLEPNGNIDGFLERMSRATISVKDDLQDF